MKIKKFVALFLALSFVSMFTTPLFAENVTQTSQMSLTDFLKTTENIKASYSYPSMKLSVNGAGKSVLPANTPIVIRNMNTISTKEIVSGDTITFSVVTDCKDAGGNILIKSGTPVSAQISFSKAKGMIGKSGELVISDFSTTAVDGTYVPLSSTVSAKTDDKMVVSIVLSVLICPLFLLMKGDEAIIPAGTQKTAYTMSEVYVKPVKI